MAAVDHALDPKGHLPPPDLTPAIQCMDRDKLPFSGGVLDQPAGLVARYTTLYNFWFAHKSMLQNLGNYEEWQKANPEMVGIVMKAKRMKEEIEDGGIE